MTGVIILAAGPSSRLGTPKQNLIYEDSTLLRRSIEASIASVCRPVLVVLGANAEVIRPAIEGLPINIIQNAGWQEGMASSIRAGIMALQEISPKVTSAILMLCDQPFVSAVLLNRLAELNPGKGIVASAYNDTVGAPVLFDKTYFGELLLLKGQEGAKTFLLKYRDDVVTVPFPLGEVDIDTAGDIEQLNRSQTK